MPASLILVLARVRRRFIVSPEIRNARAMSSVASPATARSVSATCASGASAGWQQVKMSSSRSSGISVSSTSASADSGSVAASSRSLAARTRSRRIRSIARFRAVVTSHATGLDGVPSAGQRCAAAANASAAASSASSKSPRNPTSAASTRLHSSRKTCSSEVRMPCPGAGALRWSLRCAARESGWPSRSPGRGCPPHTGSSRRRLPWCPRTARR